MKKLGKIQTLAIASLAAVALAAPIAIAQMGGTANEGSNEATTRAERRGEGRQRAGRGGRRGHVMRRGGGMMLRRLNLTEAQQTQIRQIRESHRARIQPLRQELRAKQQQFRQANAGGVFNEALATQHLTEIAPLRARLMGEQARLRQETLAVLTAEQRAQIEQMRGQRRARQSGRRERRQNQ